jgi:RNA polymerase sigma-70 factor (ECF subfamily)
MFEILVDRWGNKLYRYLFHYFAFDEQKASDALQEVLLHVWKKLHLYDQSQSFSTWLYTLARHRTIDWLRMQKKDTQTDDVTERLVDPESIQERSIRKQFLIESLLKRLLPEQREVIVLYYFEEYSYEEIGQIVGKPKNTIGTLLSRAKKALVECVQRDALLSDALEIDLDFV